MDATQTWTVIPGHEAYEVNDAGEVRSWKLPGSRDKIAERPHMLTPTVDGYVLDGQNIGLDRILTATFGMQHHGIARSERDLTPFEVREVRELEGIKHARDVAKEFRIYASRVRSIWDGKE